MVLDMTNEQKQALLELWFDYYPRVRVIARIDGSVVPDGITPIPNHEGYALFDMGWGQAVPCPPTVTTRDIQVTLLFAGRTHQCRFPLENVCTVANMDSGTEYMSLGFEQTVERRKPELRLV